MPTIPRWVKLSRMRQRPRIVIAQQQRLALNSRLHRSIQLLQHDAVGLTQFLEQEAAENPHLRLTAPDAPRPGDWWPRWSGVFSNDARPIGAETLTGPEPSLIAHVSAAIRRLDLSPDEARIALTLTEALEPSGWLGRPVEAMAKDLNQPKRTVEATLKKLQTIDPAGLYARSLSECLALQARDLGVYDRIMAAMLANLDLLAKGSFPALAARCGCDLTEVSARFRLIRSMNPKPGAGFAGPEPAQGREPDLLATALPDGGWRLDLNRSSLPGIVIDAAPNAQAAEGALGAAKAIKHMIEARNSTLLRVGQEIVARQSAALLQGRAALRPMTMADLAESLGLHVSTISRIVAGSTLEGPRGMVALRSLFSGARGAKEQGPPALSAAALRHHLVQLVAAEDPVKPLTDAALALAIAQNTGVTLARRTIAQYRQNEAIPPAPDRRMRPQRVPKGGQGQQVR